MLSVLLFFFYNLHFTFIQWWVIIWQKKQFISPYNFVPMKVDGDIFWERNIVRLWNYNSLCVTALQGRVRFCQHHMWSLVTIDSTKQRSAVGVCVGGVIMKSTHSHCTAGASQYKQSRMSQRNADILSHDYFKYYFTTVSFLVLFILHIFILFLVSFL